MVAPPAGSQDDAATLLRDARESIDAGRLRDALAPLNRARLAGGDPSVHLLSTLWQRRCESAMPDSFIWDWAVLPSDDFGIPEGLGELRVGFAWLLREEIQAAGEASVAPFPRVLRAIERTQPSSGIPIRPEAARHSIQTTEGIKSRLAMLPGPTGKPLYTGPLDGSSDPKLAEAVRAFQSTAGLNATGVIDAQTIRLIAEKTEQRLLEAPAEVDPSTIPALAAEVPARRILRSSLRLREGIFFFEAFAQNAAGAMILGPVSAGGALEDAPAIARSAIRTLLDRREARRGESPSLGDLAEMGRIELLLARGDHRLSLQRIESLAERSPGWSGIGVLREIQLATPDRVAGWEESWEARLRLIGSLREEEILETTLGNVSDLPRRGVSAPDSRRGPVTILGDQGRIRVEGNLP